jgi:predicted acyl esterase
MLSYSRILFRQTALMAVLLLFLFSGNSLTHAQNLKRPANFDKWNLPLLPPYGDFAADTVLRFDFTVTMRDGVIMDCIKFVPNAPIPDGGWPTVIMVHGYGDNKETLAGFCKAQAAYGYYTMTYSVRGQGNSGGLSNLISNVEMFDLLEIINYVKADVTTGAAPDKILIMGGSQGGVLPFRAACNGAPVKTIITSVAPPNFASSWIENGCVKMTLLWTIEYTPDTARYTPVVDRMSDWIYADNKKYWDSLAYWLPVGRDFMNEIPNCSIPVLVEASWQDKFFNADGVMQALNLLDVSFSSYIGAVQGHGGDHSPTEDQWHMNWFNNWFFQWLYNIETPILTMPKFQYASTTFPVQNNYWSFIHDSSSIPLADITTNLRLYFNRNSRLTTTPNNNSKSNITLRNKVASKLTMLEAVNEEFNGPVFDSKFAKHSVTFESSALTQPAKMTGTPKINVQFQSSANTFVQLNYQIYEVQSNGEIRFITRANYMDRKYVKNSKRTANFKGQAHSHIFQAGSKIRIVITNFDWANTDFSFLSTNPFVLPSLKNGNHKIFLYNKSFIDLPIEQPAGVFAENLLEDDGAVNNTPYEYILMQNYPNPFNPATTINFSLAAAGKVELKVYDILGREIMTLVNDFKDAGSHSVFFNAANLSSGVYFYRISSGSFNDVKKMVLVK